MEKLKSMIDKNPKLKSDKSQYLKIKDAGGPIRVKLVGCENATGRDYQTQRPVKGVNLLFEQDGVPKQYFVPTLGKDGKFHYLIERFANIEEGTELILEYQKKAGSVQGFINVEVVGEEEVDPAREEEIPVVEEEDGNPEEDTGGEFDSEI